MARCQPGCDCGKHRAKGRPLSDEHKQAISEGQKRRYEEAREQVVEEPTRKKCTGCKEWKHLDEFRTNYRVLASGERKAYPRPECKECAKERRRRWYEEKTPEERAEMNRRYDENRDPEERKAYQRDYQALSRRRQGIKPRGPWKRYRTPARGPLLPRGPFVEWVKANYDDHTTLAKKMGVDEARIRSIVKGYYFRNGEKRPIQKVPLDFVDRALLASGKETGLWELYPSLYD